MNRTYTATGINLKSIPLGENDRIITILTKELGLVRAVAPGARKAKSRLGGRSELFVVNNLLLSKGRSLDRITQAETIATYPGLSGSLGKLAAGQYLAELVLAQAMDEQPQEQLFYLLSEHLSRLQAVDSAATYPVLACLNHGTYHLLAVAGLAPQALACCLTRRPLLPQIGVADWRVGFSVPGGGTVSLEAIAEEGPKQGSSLTPITHYLNAIELTLLQQLASPTLSDTIPDSPKLRSAWIYLEKVLRQYAQYHLGRSIRSAQLIETFIASFAIDEVYS